MAFLRVLLTKAGSAVDERDLSTDWAIAEERKEMEDV